MRQSCKKITVDVQLARLGSDNSANLIFNADILISGTLRNKRRTFAANGPEFIGKHGFKSLKDIGSWNGSQKRKRTRIEAAATEVSM